MLLDSQGGPGLPMTDQMVISLLGRKGGTRGEIADVCVWLLKTESLICRADDDSPVACQRRTALVSKCENDMDGSAGRIIGNL